MDNELEVPVIDEFDLDIRQIRLEPFRSTGEDRQPEGLAAVGRWPAGMGDPEIEPTTDCPVATRVCPVQTAVDCPEETIICPPEETRICPQTVTECDHTCIGGTCQDTDCYQTCGNTCGCPDTNSCVQTDCDDACPVTNDPGCDDETDNTCYHCPGPGNPDETDGCTGIGCAGETDEC
jgi:hypothetical protein